MKPPPALTVAPSGISTTTLASGCRFENVSSCCGIWKYWTSSGRSPCSRIPELPEYLPMSMPCRCTTTEIGPPWRFIECGTSATARPRCPALPGPVAAACPLRAFAPSPQDLPPWWPLSPSSRIRSTPPTRPESVCVPSSSVHPPPRLGSASIRAAPGSPTSWETARLPAMCCSDRTAADAPRRPLGPGGARPGRPCRPARSRPVMLTRARLIDPGQAVHPVSASHGRLDLWLAGLHR